MKLSKKILIITMGVLLALFIAGSMLMKNELNTLAQFRRKYVDFPVMAFDQLSLSNKWSAIVKKGTQYKLEFAEDIEKPEDLFTNQGGKLIFKGDSSNGQMGYLRVTAPGLSSIEIQGNTTVHLDDFDQDSLIISMNEGRLTGKNSSLKFLSISTTGESVIELSDDGM